jgi:hypothetical protein
MTDNPLIEAWRGKRAQLVAHIARVEAGEFAIDPERIEWMRRGHRLMIAEIDARIARSEGPAND